MDEHLQRERENRGIVLMIRWEKGYVDIYYIIFMQNQIFLWIQELKKWISSAPFRVHSSVFKLWTNA